ncbi:MAG: aminotransferase class III-fold pyridoxal phosphate-dependent enzyme [Betaproteobacteria bacterium]|nr:aminotransferase class III-fold pyridoxal phosphate-dependent enzyme [Betaproteobacteria bacterium]
MALNLQSSTEAFQEKFKKSGELSAAGDQYIPGGYSRNSLTFGPHAIYVERGEGQYIHTVDGHKLLDFHNNFSCSILGHSHPKMREALLDSVSKGFSFGNPMAHEHRLAQILCERIASVDKVVFTCSASEACIAAVRYARAYTGKDKIAKFDGGYHGLGDEFTLSIHSAAEHFPGAPEFPRPVPLCGGIPIATQQNVVVLPQNDFASCKRILTQNAGQVACVMMELQTGAGGVITLQKEFVQSVRELTEELGMLLIIDETISLRSAFHGMQSLFDIKPDLTVMGKMIGGGLPLGAVGGAEKYLNMNSNGQVYHSGTHHGHPMATRAGIACMEVMDEKTYARMNAQAARLKDEINTYAKQKNLPIYFYGLGSHLGYEITDKPGRIYSSCREILTYSNHEAMQTFAFEMATRGIFPMYRGQIALSEPMTEADIDTFVRISKEVIEDIFAP